MVMLPILLVLQTAGDPIVIREPVVASADETRHATTCRGHTVAVDYANSARRAGTVRSMAIDGKDVPGAAAAVEAVAAERSIEQISFAYCTDTAGSFAIHGVVRFGAAASTRTGLAPTLSFRLTPARLERQ